ncbi:hypothetical protein Nepgr_012448 [Nepenthes gracilis]|uniref:Uncharacterized protein n=1 Tax=Nepenthes gracilis TaxID=150966 RepID=A0AAD3SHB8_NEPGR|nr:hypothetical protein Nepgr_012448 [Nepenthes gracilis]
MMACLSLVVKLDLYAGGLVVCPVQFDLLMSCWLVYINGCCCCALSVNSSSRMLVGRILVAWAWHYGFAVSAISFLSWSAVSGCFIARAYCWIESAVCLGIVDMHLLRLPLPARPLKN